MPGIDSLPPRWANQRQVFGKPLHSQAVIRAKLAAMISRVESAQNWIESITYQMTHMNYKQQAVHLAGYISFLLPYTMLISEASRPIAFVKKYCTETAQETAKDAVQVWVPFLFSYQLWVTVQQFS